MGALRGVCEDYDKYMDYAHNLFVEVTSDFLILTWSREEVSSSCINRQTSDDF